MIYNFIFDSQLCKFIKYFTKYFKSYSGWSLETKILETFNLYPKCEANELIITFFAIFTSFKFFYCF